MLIQQVQKNRNHDTQVLAISTKEAANHAFASWKSTEVADLMTEDLAEATVLETLDAVDSLFDELAELV